MSEDDLQEPLLEPVGSSPEPEVKKLSSKKRKREEKETSGTTAKKPKSKKAKAKEEDEDLDLEAGLNNAFSHMNNQLLADYIAQRTRKCESELSTVELEDRYIPACSIEDTTIWEKPRNLDNLPGFLEKFSGNTTKLWSASKKSGAPHTIIVTAAGLRAADVVRAVKKFPTKDAKVAKLFAKHIKIQDSIKFLKSSRTGIAVGTPARLRDLMEDGALQVDRLERIVVDASHIDLKKRGILEMRDTQIPLIAWLGRKEFRDRYAASEDGIQLLFY